MAPALLQGALGRGSGASQDPLSLRSPQRLCLESFSLLATCVPLACSPSEVLGAAEAAPHTLPPALQQHIRVIGGGLTDDRLVTTLLKRSAAGLPASCLYNHLFHTF